MFRSIFGKSQKNPSCPCENINLELFNDSVNKSDVFMDEECSPSWNETTGTFEWIETFGTCGTVQGYFFHFENKIIRMRNKFCFKPHYNLKKVIEPVEINNETFIQISKSFYQKAANEAMVESNNIKINFGMNVFVLGSAELCGLNTKLTRTL